MTKSEEIETLRKFAKTLPAGSYLAELFKHIIPQFERDIRSDLYVLPNLAALADELAELQDQVKKEASQVNALLRQKTATADEISSLRSTERDIKARLEPIRNILNSLRL